MSKKQPDSAALTEFTRKVMAQAELLTKNLNKSITHYSITNPTGRHQEVFGAWVINQLAETHVHIQQLNNNLNAIMDMMVNAGVIEVKMLGDDDVEVGTDVPQPTDETVTTEQKLFKDSGKGKDSDGI